MNAFTAQLTTKGGSFRTGVAWDKSLDAVEFDGIDDAFRFPEFMDSSNLTIYAVAKCTGGADDRILFMDWSDNGGGKAYFFFKTATGALGLRDHDSDVFEHGTGSQLFDNDWATAVVVLSDSGGTDFTIEVGEVGATSSDTESGGTEATSYSATTWELNGYNNSGPTLGKFLLRLSSEETHHFGGQLAEFLVYDHALSAPDRAAVEAYLYNKYHAFGSMLMFR
jgi:hypothetical protein